MNKTVLLTGATGFLGSYIAEALVNGGIAVIALKRKSSDCWRCKSVYNKIKWVDIDVDGVWKEEVIHLKPSHIIHGAWIGVEAKDRDDLRSQIENIDLLVDLLEIAKKTKVCQFIGLGSQAEYGFLDKIVSENELVNPTTIYGATKVASQQIVKTFCELNQINWVWLRLFSFIGDRENENWLIPTLIKNITNEIPMDMSPGEQRYAYMYVEDFSKIMLNIVCSEIESGIYNISGNSNTSLKELVTVLGLKIGINPKINWGVLPYRENQSMLIQGNMDKLLSNFSEIRCLSINDILTKVVSNIKNKD